MNNDRHGKKFRVYLVNAGNDPGLNAHINDSCYPALGILELGTWLKSRLPDIEVICRDGQIMSHEEIAKEIEELKPDLVGTSVLCTSYQSSLKIADAAKKAGAKVVFGNDQASQLSQEVLKNRPNVDYVVGAEYGEEPLELLVRSLRGENIKLSDIPTLTYRGDDGTIKGFQYVRDKGKLAITKSFTTLNVGKPLDRKTGLDIIPLIDWSLYPKSHWDTYKANFRRKFGNQLGVDATGVVTMNRARGCSRANEAIKCTHCDMLLDIAFSSPEIFWQEVRNAHEKIGANVFYEVCDSFSSFGSLIRGIAAAKPKDLGFEPHFFVYCQALDLVRHPDLAQKLKEIGVFRVNIGLESGSDTTLKFMKGKDDSVDVNYRALKLLKEQGLYVYGSFVLGSDPETPDTLKETIGWIKKIVKEGLIDDLEAQPALPLPHNYYGKKMIAEAGERGNPFMAPDGATDWPFDTDSVARNYINKHCVATYDQVVEAVGQIREITKEAGVRTGSAVFKGGSQLK